VVAPFSESEQLGSHSRPSDTDVETGQPRKDVCLCLNDTLQPGCDLW